MMSVQDAIGRKEWAKAVLISLHLNERELREKAVDAVPMSEVALTAAAVPAPYALRLLGVLADRFENGLGAGRVRYVVLTLNDSTNQCWFFVGSFLQRTVRGQRRRRRRPRCMRLVFSVSL